MATQADRGLPVTIRVLVVDADNALFGLIEEWLAAAGHHAIAESAAGGGADGGIDLVLVDIPFPRQGGLDTLRRIAVDYPGKPVLALSSAFFAGIGANGAVARALGVAGALPKPVKREALMTAVGELLGRPR